MSDQRQEIIESLKQTMDEAQWQWLLPHLQRDALVLVKPELDLLDVAYRIAIDDRPAVQAWVESGKLAKPTPAQVREWERHPDKRFTVVVVQPYVLAQEALFH
ncbi:MAG: DUF2288 domain-containing protein [Oligoflexia bacterium]|nr:DUF2288 domain-containing protein [Oligoflexia bacterium]